MKKVFGWLLMIIVIIVLFVGHLWPLVFGAALGGFVFWIVFEAIKQAVKEGVKDANKGR